MGFIAGTVFVFVCLGIFLGYMQYKNMVASQPKKDISTAAHTVAIPTPQGSSITPAQVYIVQENESLWDIAQKEYHNGEEWVILAKANGITQPSRIYTNDKLIIPVLDSATPQSSLSTVVPPTQKIDSTPSTPSSSYVVTSGDTIWDIAVTVYGDGYRYKEIIAANNLENPNTIFAGNVLTIPQK